MALIRTKEVNFGEFPLHPEFGIQITGSLNDPIVFNLETGY